MTDKTDVFSNPAVTKSTDGTGAVIVQLSTPVQLTTDGAPMTSVTMMPLKGKDMVAMLNAKGEGSRTESMILASVQLSGPMGDAFINNVEASDYLLLAEVAGTFLDNGQTSGTSSSQASSAN